MKTLSAGNQNGTFFENMHKKFIFVKNLQYRVKGCLCLRFTI